MERGTRSERDGGRRIGGAALVLAFTMGGALVYVACSSTSGTPGVALTGDDGGLDGASTGVNDSSVAPFDANLIPTPLDAAGGNPCVTASDCTPGLLCLFPVAEGCSAHGVCTSFDGSCGGPYCTCRGDSTGACGDFGYAQMEYPLHGPPCFPFEGDASAGDAAGDAGDAD